MKKFYVFLFAVLFGYYAASFYLQLKFKFLLFEESAVGIRSGNAITGVTPRRHFTSSLAVWRETPNDVARVETFRPKSGIKSSRSTSPGWVGVIIRFCIFNAHGWSSLIS